MEVIYFVQQGQSGPIKIGRTRNIRGRLDQMANNNSCELLVRALVPGSVMLERELHMRFGRHLLRGEWFHPHPEIVGYIATLPEALLRDLKYRRKYRKGLPLEDAKAIWVDPALTTAQARAMIGWGTRKIQEVLGRRRPIDGRWRSPRSGLKALVLTDLQTAKAEAIWRNVRRWPTWADVETALQEQVHEDFTRWRGHRMFGPRQSER